MKKLKNDILHFSNFLNLQKSKIDNLFTLFSNALFE